MSNNNYLLTYVTYKDGLRFDWFETEEELREFVRTNSRICQIFDAIKINDAEDIHVEI